MALLSREKFQELRNEGLSVEQIISFQKKTAKAQIDASPPKKFNSVNEFAKSMRETPGQLVSSGVDKFADIVGGVQVPEFIKNTAGGFIPGGGQSINMVSKYPKEMATAGIVGTAAMTGGVPQLVGGVVGSKLLGKAGEIIAPEGYKDVGGLIGELGGGYAGYKGGDLAKKAIAKANQPVYTKPIPLEKARKTVEGAIKKFKKEDLGRGYDIYDDMKNVSVGGKKEIQGIVGELGAQHKKEFSRILGKSKTLTVDNIKKIFRFLDSKKGTLKPDKATPYSATEIFNIKRQIKDNYLFPALDRVNPKASSIIKQADKFYSEYAQKAYNALGTIAKGDKLTNVLKNKDMFSQQAEIFDILDYMTNNKTLPKGVSEAISLLRKRGVLEKVVSTITRGAEAGLGAKFGRGFIK